MTQPCTVLVTGATGQQGGSVARALLGKGHRVRALTRHPDSGPARDLARLGAETVYANFDDRLSLIGAARGADVVFAVSTPFEAGTAVEVSQGLGLLEACKRAEVARIILSSVAGADQRTGIPHFDSKHRLEQHAASMGVAFSIVAPVFFMENLLASWMLPALRDGRLALALPAMRKVQMIAVEDIGAFVAELVADPKLHAGERVEIAGDDVTGMDAADVLTRASGDEIEYAEIGLDQVGAASEDMARVFAWLRDVEVRADLPALRRNHARVGWHTLEAWARKQDWAILKPTSER